MGQTDSIVRKGFEVCKKLLFELMLVGGDISSFRISVMFLQGHS